MCYLILHLCIFCLAFAPAPLTRVITRQDLLGVRWTTEGTSGPYRVRFHEDGKYTSESSNSGIWWEGTWDLTNGRLEIECWARGNGFINHSTYFYRVYRVKRKGNAWTSDGPLRLWK